jgi:hypothetical protein
MQTSLELRPLRVAPARALTLAAVFFVAAAAAWALQAAPPAQSSRWPTDDSLYAVDGWRVSPPTVEAANGNIYLTRRYQPAEGGTPMTFIVTTSQSVKSVYRAGPDVPYLGSGYENVPLPAGLVRDGDHHQLSQVRRGNEGWLQVYAYGERRGLVGNGPVGWGLAVFDKVLGQPNDYYLMRVLVPVTTVDIDTVQRAIGLSDVLIQRVAGWYAS